MQIRNVVGAGLLVSFALSGLALADIQTDIVGGRNVKSSDPIEKTVVALYQSNGTEGMLCTATLIAKDMALTAAHCVEGGIDHMEVIFGSQIDSDQAEAMRVTRAEVPRAWGETHTSDRDLGDIAVVRLEGNLPKGYHPAHLLPKKYTVTKGQEVLLAGYGISDPKKQSGAGDLRKTTVTVADPVFGKTEILFDQSAGSGACHGDSGGPAFVQEGKKLYLLGVTNRAYPDNAPDDCKHQVVYTKATAYQKWIAETVRYLRSND